MGNPQNIIFCTMTWRDMHQPCALFGGDVISRQHWHIMIIALAMKRVHQDGIFECIGRYRSLTAHACDAASRGDIIGKVISKDQTIPYLGKSVFCNGIDMIDAIGDLFTIGGGAVARHCPWGCRPDHDLRASQFSHR